MSVLIELENALEKELPFQRKNFKKAFSDMEEELKVFLLKYIRLCEKSDMSVVDIAAAYAMLVRETMKEQIYFSKHHKYRYTTYEEVRGKVYDNSEFMKKYMIGLGISLVLWENHVTMYKFFESFINDNDYHLRGGTWK